jgi:hypothetical protein
MAVALQGAAGWLDQVLEDFERFTVRRTQPGGLHSLLVLPLVPARPAAGLVQVGSYRSRAVIEPRSVLKEFGVDIADETRIKVWDSSADLRYMVLPERPAGTEGWAEERLAALVSREAMIGTSVVTVPEAVRL